MKNTAKQITGKFLFVFLLLCLLYSCTPKPAYNNIKTAETTFVESTGDGIVTIKAIGYGTDFGLAHADATQRAFETIMLRGLPHFTALSRPMIESENSLNSSHPNFMQNFFDNDSHSQFIIEQGETYIIEEFKKPKGVRIGNTFTINYAGLRRYLEKEGVIRKFGY